MKTLQTITLFFLASALFSACQGNQNQNKDFDKLQRSLNPIEDITMDENDQSDIQAIYFHATRRCATCEAVESVTQSALKEYYGDKVSFSSINRDEEKDNPLIAEHKISGQTLLIIKGNEVVNLTNDAFMNARSQPDKFKEKLKTTIDAMM